MHILVVGAGSIGQRHIKNLWDLDVRTVVVDPRQPFDEPCFDTIEEALEQHNPDAAIVAVPTHLHMEVAHKLAHHNMPLFIEKPVSHEIKGAVQLCNIQGRFNQWAVVGYSMRFHPAIQIIKDLLPQIGTPLYARAEVGQYLPDWHPEEDYRNWYMAHEDQGGGALLDLSHEIDYMRWLFGGVWESTIQGTVSRHSNLEIDSDDLVEFQCYMSNKEPYDVLCSIHMDLLDRSYNRRLRIVGSEGTISWDAPSPNTTGDSAVWLYTPDTLLNAHLYNADRNIQFKEEMRAFVDSVQSGEVHPTLATLEDGIEVLKVVLELKKQNGR